MLYYISFFISDCTGLVHIREHYFTWKMQERLKFRDDHMPVWRCLILEPHLAVLVLRRRMWELSQSKCEKHTHDLTPDPAVVSVQLRKWPTAEMNKFRHVLWGCWCRALWEMLTNQKWILPPGQQFLSEHRLGKHYQIVTYYQSEAAPDKTLFFSWVFSFPDNYYSSHRDAAVFLV